MADTAEARQLEEQGYTFHGAYSWNKDEIKARAAKLREEGHKARMVWTPGSKYSRSGSGGGWSVYWIESEESKLARKERQLQGAIFSIERELAEMETKKAELEARLAELKGTEGK